MTSFNPVSDCIRFYNSIPIGSVNAVLDLLKSKSSSSALGLFHVADKKV